MNFNEKLINLRKSKGLSQEELGNELKVSRQTISKWESCQSYPDFQRLVLLSDFFGLTLDELVRDIDVQEVREKNLNNEKLSSIYDDINEGNSIEKILALYDPYISKCCLRPFYDKYGNVCIVVDMELKGRIREALIKMILDFDIPLETEE